MQRKNGFTLTELMIVVSIIALLAAGVTIALQNARLSSRDARRVNDIAQIRAALNMYYGRYNSYPTAITSGHPLSIGSTIYMISVPSNPRPRNDGICDVNKEYDYAQQDGGLSYTLSFCLGSSVEGISAGVNLAVPDDIVNVP